MNLNEVEEYVLSHTTDDSNLIRELIRTSGEELEYTDMMSGRLVGRLLGILIKISGTKRVLEVGTFTGYSAMTMAEALPEEGELYTCEYNERYGEIAGSFFDRSEHSSKITLIMGDARQTIPNIKGSFDFVFLDADKINYPEYYDMLLPRINSGGLMVVDNVLWGGEVMNAVTEKAEAINRLNQQISTDERVEQVMLTVRDGITVVRKNEKPGA